SLKERPTEAEVALLDRIRRPDVGEWFHFQAVVCAYIVDFYCKKLRLVIEVDGTSHRTTEGRAKDSVRDRILDLANIKVLRFRNEQVLGDIESVIDRIKSEFGWLAKRKAAQKFAALGLAEDSIADHLESR
ncbi:MAG: DUF559 domain-containing protein, partial [Patescibacteria group bacterium]|nr:DUF559 domain-containing protein [Patescibacteria group bacterium]